MKHLDYVPFDSPNPMPCLRHPGTCGCAEMQAKGKSSPNFVRAKVWSETEKRAGALKLKWRPKNTCAMVKSRYIGDGRPPTFNRESL